jgi:hypothetical protein
MQASFNNAVMLIAMLVPCLAPGSVLAQTASQALSKRTAVIRDCGAISVHDPDLAPVSAVCEFVKSMDRALPNFVCKQTTQRYFPIDASYRQSEERRPDDILADTVSATVTYEDGVDQYSDVEIGDKPAQQDAFFRTGPITTGDFGSELLSVLLKENATTFSFRGQENGPDGVEYVFDFRIPAATNHAFTYREDGSETHPDLLGVLRVSKETNDVRRLEILAKNIDPAFSADHVQFSTIFGKVKFGDAGEFLLPRQSESTVCTRKRLCRHNVTQWVNCKRLSAKSRMIFGVK